jgi:hypothetical protein
MLAGSAAGAAAHLVEVNLIAGADDEIVAAARRSARAAEAAASGAGNLT